MDPCRFAGRAARHASWRLHRMTTVAADRLRRGQLPWLRTAGWRTALVWACALSGDRLGETMQELAAWIRSDSGFTELP